MRTIFTKIATAVTATLATATPALAGTLYSDNGSFMVVAFFGCCALLIALIPDERKVRCDEIAEQQVRDNAEDRKE